MIKCKIHKFKLKKNFEYERTCCICGYQLPKIPKIETKLPIWKGFENKRFVIHGFDFKND